MSDPNVDGWNGRENTLSRIKGAIQDTKYNHVTPKQVLNDAQTKSPDHNFYDKTRMDWRQWIIWTYPAPTPVTLKEKVAAAAKLVNGDFYHDEVTDIIKSHYGDKTKELSVDDIADFIKDNEFILTGMI